jgi:hypothetical protein
MALTPSESCVKIQSVMSYRKFLAWVLLVSAATWGTYYLLSRTAEKKLPPARDKPGASAADTLNENLRKIEAARRPTPFPDAPPGPGFVPGNPNADPSLRAVRDIQSINEWNRRRRETVNAAPPDVKKP